MLAWARRTLEEVKRRMVEINFENLVWLINAIPNIVGYPRNEASSGPFWFVHISLLIYIYVGGCAAYQLNHAVESDDYFKSNLNIAMLIIISNITLWWMSKRSLLTAVLKGLEESDRKTGTAASEDLKKNYLRLLRRIKYIIIAFNIPQLFDAMFIYLPHRLDVENSFGMGMVSCVGLEPLTSSPNKEICMFIIVAQEYSVIITSIHYQTTLIFLIATTTCMFLMLTQEMMDLNKFENIEEQKYYARKHLPSLVKRHALMLEIVDHLQNLYSFSTGVDFGFNGLCLCLLFFVSAQVLLTFISLLVYCFLSFFMYCFLCQRLTNAAEDFEMAVYSCGWENFDLREKRMVYIMFLLAQKPVVILAADIIPVNMYTFATALQFMYKFVTLVKY